MAQHSKNPIVVDIIDLYAKYRRTGKNRVAAIEQIRKDFAEELQDEEDGLAVLMGLTLSLCKKRELFEPFKSETLNNLHDICRNSVFDVDTATVARELESYLNNVEYLGEEALYKQKGSYVPDWKIGDLFSHVLTYPYAETLGIKEWCILLYKVGEYTDANGMLCQLLYVSLCPPNKIPSSESEFSDLGFLRMMRLGEKSEYLAQMSIKSEQEEAFCNLTKIGHYPDVHHPVNNIEENPFTAMPLQGRTRQSKHWPGFEDQICRLYRKYGL